VRPAVPRRIQTNTADRNTLKFVPVDGSHGDIDPTLKLGLLARVREVPPANGLRNVFEAGGPEKVLPPAPKNPPIIPVTDQAPQPTALLPPPTPPFNIPLKYYGFVKPLGERAADGNRGFFMDGDNILVGGEGDLLERKYLIVALTPNSARLEDTQAKQGQELPVTPAAQSAQ
jgi:hypothetical protein